MRVPLEITFGKSPSAHYGQAVQRARAFSGYRRTGAGQAVVHTVRVKVSLAHEATWEKLHPLLHLVSGWRSSCVTVAGHSVRYWELAGRLDQVRACYVRKVQQSAGPGYCSGKQTPGGEAVCFGCRLSSGISRQVNARDSWIQFGTLSAKRDSFRSIRPPFSRPSKNRCGPTAASFAPPSAGSMSVPTSPTSPRSSNWETTVSSRSRPRCSTPKKRWASSPRRLRSTWV